MILKFKFKWILKYGIWLDLFFDNNFWPVLFNLELTLCIDDINFRYLVNLVTIVTLEIVMQFQ